MSIDRAEEYRRKAQECVAHAQRVSSAADKATWLQMAENWQRLAENAEGSPTIQVHPDLIADQEPKNSN